MAGTPNESWSPPNRSVMAAGSLSAPPAMPPIGSYSAIPAYACRGPTNGQDPIGPLPPCWGGLGRSKAPPPPAGEGWGEGKPVGHQTLCHGALVDQAIYRSLMFVPGSSEKMLTKAIGL